MTARPSLTEQAIAGDATAFGKLVRQHDDAMRALAYQMLGSRSAMDDVLQTAYLKAFRSIGSFRAEASFATWLNRIVVNACYDWQRKRGRQSEVSLHVVPEIESLDSMEDRTTTSQLLHAALQTLPSDQRAAVLLVDGQGMSYEQAAQAMDIELGTVASRLNRGRSALRQELNAQEDGNQ